MIVLKLRAVLSRCSWRSSHLLASLTAILLILPLVTSCSLFPKTKRSVSKSQGIIDRPLEQAPKDGNIVPELPDEFRQALALLDEQKFQEALSVIDGYLSDEPADPYAQSMALSAGRALEGLGRWSDAADRYRGVVVATEVIAPKLQAMALYRLSFCHEARGDDQQTVAVLYDLNQLNQRSKYLPDPIARAELPARLAAGYARVGNFNKAVDFYRVAEAGIVQLKRESASSGEKIPDWLPRTLYFMGSMSLRHVSWLDFESAMRPLTRAQTYLVQSADLGMAPWSDRAARDLMATYQDLWNVILNAPVAQGEDPIVQARAIEEKQVDRTGLVQESLEELRARLSPASPDALSPQSKEIAGFIKDLEKEIEKFMLKRPAGEGLTPDALARRRALRGRVIGPDDVLEKKYIKTLPSKKDPNL